MPEGIDRRAPSQLALTTVRPERRKPTRTPEDCEMLLNTQERLLEGTARMERIEAQVCGVAAQQAESKEDVARLEQKLDKNSEATGELLAIISAGKGFFTVIGWLRKPVGFLASFVVSLSGLYFWLKETLK